ncbi:TetR family transcriptional regulator C-terminal domain-containing protein [Phytomonospora sp. NPDC050363]|uniref:TetR/AcrR family transcriptional regulator n=1 Tax=Phytomonospora sp. NPDC050363 TaxID=3155642 RepID=UPI00340A336B
MPENPERRAKLGDAAVRVIAREGCRGLTHRAVDREAGVPIGTAVNYHRTREDLLIAAAGRLIGPDVIDYAHAHAPAEPTAACVEDMRTLLRAIVDDAVGPARGPMYRVTFELLLEGVRRPRLREVLAELNRAELAAITAAFAAAGHHLEAEDLSRATAGLYGVIFGLLTGVPTLDEASARVAVDELADRLWHSMTPIRATPQ